MSSLLNQDPDVDPRAAVRLIVDLLWRLRRAGFTVSTAQGIDAARALDAVGPGDPGKARAALAAVLVSRGADRPRFDATFDAFFASVFPGEATPSVGRAAGSLTAQALDAFHAALRVSGHEGPDIERLLALLDRGSAFDRLLWLAESSEPHPTPGDRQIGFRTHRLLRRLGFEEARATLVALRPRLTAAFGTEGDPLSEALHRELERAENAVRAHLDERQRAAAKDSVSERARSKPFADLTEGEVEEVRVIVRRLAATLRGGARVKARRARRGGTVDAAATTRRAIRTGGVPFDLVRSRPARRSARLVVLCDVSESVRGAARFFLELAYLMQELFERTRTFTFVSDLDETTDAFARMPVARAIEHAWSAAAGVTGSNSNYGRVLRRFEREHGRDLDRRTSLVILGDGRANFRDPGLDALRRLRARVRNLIWLCPEPRGRWGDADSAMALYASRCTAVYEVVCVDDLADAVRALSRAR